MDEKKLLHLIRQSAGEEEIPSSLHPDNIRKKLESIPKTPSRRSRFLPFAAAAAVFLLSLGAAWQAFAPVSAPSDLESSPTASLREDDTAHVSPRQTDGEAVPGKVSVTGLKEAEDYTTIYGILSEQFSQTYENVYYEGAGIETAPEAGGSATESAAIAEDTAEKTSSSGSSDFSGTNIQELGVDEGDTVRTDGTWLYILDSSGSVRIIQADKGNLNPVGTITLPSFEETPVEMYLDKDTLCLITSGSDADLTQSETSEDVYRLNTVDTTCLYTYDISDRTSPVLSGRVTQEGFYRTSRKQGNFLYLFTEYSPRLAKTEEDSSFIPIVQGKRLAAEDILLPEAMNTPSCLVVSAVDITAPYAVTDQKAIVSAADIFYVSQENIYVCNTCWQEDTESTQILKFSYENGKISPLAAGEIPGTLNDSFSLNEYEENLRVVTTSWESSSKNHLYVLDRDLNIIGRLTNLAPDETIRSARYFGNTAYFVTFEETDPLFSVDVSDPTNPILLGELKITGFSSYLHFYGENRLLGLGYEVDPDTGIYTGIKLSMFDISDPANVQVLHKYIIEDASYCPALYDYKKLLVDPEKNILGFSCENSYLVFSYNPDQGFVSLFSRTFQNTDASSVRGLFVADTFYLTDLKSLWAYDMNREYSESGSVTF